MKMAGSDINCVDVVKEFGEGQATLVLNHVDLRISPSEIVCVVGPSGCGKTTLLNIVAGFDQPTAGTCAVDGEESKEPGPDRGFVFQRATLYPWMNVWNNVTLGSRVGGVMRSEYEPRAEELLKITGLNDFKKHYPHQISGGMAQRAQLVRVLLAEPKAILMDEPFGALDYQTRLSMHKLLIKLHQSYSPTVMFITHDVDEAIFLANRVVVMSKRPSTIIEDIIIDLPHPRSVGALAEPRIANYKSHILDLLGIS